MYATSINILSATETIVVLFIRRGFPSRLHARVRDKRNGFPGDVFSQAVAHAIDARTSDRLRSH